MEPRVETGTVLCGKFLVERVIGSGAMGLVISAQHMSLRERVAIKLLRGDLSANPEIVARFEREARAAVKIRSEHVARVSDVGRLEDGAPFMVMEYLEGQDLGAHLRERGPLPLADVADYLLQACEAIALAHSLGIVHRDLKPENLFITQRPDGSPCIKVLDFGISKILGLGATSELGVTVAGGLMGSPLYMSPEQFSSAKDVDTRADIWALGVILYELLAGKTPFIGENLPQLCNAICVEPAPSIRKALPGIPRGVDELILACLVKDRDRRLATIGQFVERLVEFAPEDARLSAKRARRLASSARIAAPAATVASNSDFAVTKHPTERRRVGWRWALGGAGALAIAAVAYALGRSSPVADSQAPPVAEATTTAAATSAVLAAPVATADPPTANTIDAPKVTPALPAAPPASAAAPTAPPPKPETTVAPTTARTTAKPTRQRSVRPRPAPTVEPESAPAQEDSRRRALGGRL